MESTDAGCDEDLVFADQGGGGYLRHHEAGVQTRAGREKGRQVFVERGINEALQTTLGDAGQRAQCDGQKIERKGQGLAVEIAAGEDVAGDGSAHDGFGAADFADLGEDQGIVDRRVHLDFEDGAAMGESVAHGAVDLRNAAQGVGVLHLAAVAMGLADFAALQHPEEVAGDEELTGMGAGRPGCARRRRRSVPLRASTARAPSTSAVSARTSACRVARSPTASIAWVPLMSEMVSLASSTRGLMSACFRASAAGMRLPWNQASPSPMRTSPRWERGARSPLAPTLPCDGITG